MADASHDPRLDGAPDPSGLMRWMTAYWESAALFAAHRLGIFRALAEEACSAEQLAARLNLDVRGTRMLLEACRAMGLAAREREAYSLTPLAAAYLVPGSPACLGGGLEWAAAQWNSWSQIDRAVRSGEPVERPQAHLGEDEEQTRRFVLAMHARALGVARGVAPHLGLDGCRAVLDVGAGSGAYAGLLAERNPTMRVAALDLPGILRHTRELIAEAGLADRVECIPGDAEEGQYGASEYDGVLFSGVLHQFPAESIARMLRGAHRALIPGGRVAISDVMREADGGSAVFAALFSLQMLLTTAAGEVFTAAECVEWLKHAGFVGVKSRTLPPPLPYTVITARKPE